MSESKKSTKKVTKADDDAEPPKKKKPVKSDDDAEPPKKKKPVKTDDEDADPPKKKKTVKADDEDAEPPKKKKPLKDDEDKTPSKRNLTTETKKKKPGKDDDEDVEPPKKKTTKKTGDDDDKTHELEHKLSEKEKEVENLKSQLQSEKKKLEVELLDLRKQHDLELAKVKSELSKAGATSEKKADNSTAITTEPKTGTTVKINGEWKGPTAGGSMNQLTWRYNPQIFVRPSKTVTATIKLSQPPSSTYPAIGYYIFEGDCVDMRRLLIASTEDVLLKTSFTKTESNEKTLELNKSSKPYVIIPCTLNPGDERTFTLQIQADGDVTAQLISHEQEWPQPTIMGEWAGETAGGCVNHETFTKNPQFLLKIEKQSQVKFLLLQEKLEEFDNVALYVVEVEPNRSQKITERSVVRDKSKVVVPAVFEDPQTFSASASLKPGSYAIIPSTFEPGQEAQFKLMVLSETPFPLIKELQDAACLSISGVWNGETAGGCLNDVRAWRGNTQYLLQVQNKEVEVTFKLKQTSIIGTNEIASVGFYIFLGGKRVVRPKVKNIFLKSKFVKKNDGLTQKVKLPVSEEPYIIVPCTFKTGEEGAYTLSIYSDDPNFTENVKLSPLPKERDLQKFVSKGEWEGPTAGGCLNYATWRNNPQFLLDVSRTCDVTIFVTCKTDKPMKPGFYVVNSPTNSNIKVDMKKGEEPVLKCPFYEAIEVVKSHKFEPGRYNVIPCTYDYASEGRFEVSVYVSDFGAVEFRPIPAGLLSIRGEWTAQNAGGCINDVKSWFTNPHFFLAVKQHTEVAAVLVQSPGQDNIPHDQLLEIGFYITNSDGHGKPKINEEKDLIAKANFAPDKDSVSVTTLPASHWPYVVTPCTFKPQLTGKFELTLLMDKESLEFVELSKDPIQINPAEVVGAGEDPAMREIRRKFKPLSGRTLELVQYTESTASLPEHLKFIGRTLLQTVAQFQDSIVAWGEDKEPQWWLDGYEEEYVEEAAPPAAPAAPDAPPPPPPAPKQAPPINFSKPVKMQMVESSKQSAITQEMIDELETKKQNFVDELLHAVQGGIKNLKKVEIVKPPPPTNSFECAFNIEILNKRRAAIEGIHDKPDDDWDDNWNDVEDA